MDEINVDALFLGPKSENYKFFKEMLNFVMDDFMNWRKDFHPTDKPAITQSDQSNDSFKETLLKTRHILVELAGKLQVSSMPWFSPRYLGHMNTDTLMAANLAYMLTILYNPNNCAYEGSPATTELEIEVGKQLSRLMGYNPENSWGHITAGGTIANYEGLWVARNLKSIPLAIKRVKPELANGMDEWQLLNLPTNKILNMLERIKNLGLLKAVRRYSVRGVGMQKNRLGKILLPQSKHYSWVKAADILGIGEKNIVYIKVKDNFRMDIKDLKKKIDELTGKKIPVLCVVAVLGTTEEGAIDEIHKIVKMREEYERKGISFYLHIDAAYGGYARSIFFDEDDRFMDFDELKQKLHEQEVIHKDIDWPKKEVYEAFKSLQEADSITIDPHKMGYIPYATGAIVMKDRSILGLISYFAAYVFGETEENPVLLGSYIMEGSKAGATVAATWIAHKLIPLNITGYGRIIGRGIEGAKRFYDALLEAEPFEVKGRKFNVLPLIEPDFNVVDFAFNEQGNRSLKKMNELNQKIYEMCSYKSGPVYANDFITSKTELGFDEYGDIPGTFTSRFKISKNEWDKVKNVYVLRSCILTPFLLSNTTYDKYMSNFMNTMQSKIEKVIG